MTFGWEAGLALVKTGRDIACVVCESDLGGGAGSVFRVPIGGSMMLAIFACPHHPKMDVLDAAQPILNGAVFVNDEEEWQP